MHAADTIDSAKERALEDLTGSEFVGIGDAIRFSTPPGSYRILASRVEAAEAFFDLTFVTFERTA